LLTIGPERTECRKYGFLGIIYEPFLESRRAIVYGASEMKYGQTYGFKRYPRPKKPETEA